YERVPATDAMVFRPVGERDGDVEIRVYSAVPAPRGVVALLEEWMAAHPAPGPLTGERVAPSQPADGLRIAGRVWRRGQRPIQEAITAIRTPDGAFQIAVTRLPGDRAEIRDRHMRAATEIGKMIARGEAVAAAAVNPPAADPGDMAAAIATV